MTDHVSDLQAARRRVTTGARDVWVSARSVRTYWFISTTAMSSRVVKSLNASSIARAVVSEDGRAGGCASARTGARAAYVQQERL